MGAAPKQKGKGKGDSSKDAMDTSDDSKDKDLLPSKREMEIAMARYTSLFCVVISWLFVAFALA